MGVHKYGIVHRDHRPGMVVAEGEAQLTGVEIEIGFGGGVPYHRALATFHDRPGELVGIYAGAKYVGLRDGQKLPFVYTWSSPLVFSLQDIYERGHSRR
jgi:hypothetical protein